MRRGGKIFGSILIILGALFLVSELGILDEIYAAYGISLGTIISGLIDAMMTLWPLILVALGITILFRNPWVSRITWIALIVIMIVFSAVSPGLNVHRGMLWMWDDNWNDEKITFSENTKYSDAVDYTGSLKKGRIDLELAAGSTEITSGTDKAAAITSMGRRLDYTSKTEGDTLYISAGDDHDFDNIGDFAGSNEIVLGDKLIWSITVGTGASDFSADLRALKVEKIDFSVGAGSAEIHVGDKLPAADINIEAGASSITVYVPKQSGVTIASDSGLSSIEMDGEDLSSSGSDKFESANYDEAANKIDITVSAGVSSVEIISE